MRLPRLRWLLVGALWSAAVAAPAPERPQSIRVVMDNNYPPFVFQDEDGTVRGILVDQWRLWERQTGVHVELSAMDWGRALQQMRSGQFDVIDTVFRTEERAKFLDFSAAYQRIEVPIFFDREIAGIVDAKSLRGFAVGVKAGDATIEVLKRGGVETLLTFPSYEAVVKAARDRKITVFVADAPPALYFLHKFGVQDAFRRSAPLYVGDFHRGVAKGEAALLRLVEQGFAQIAPEDLQAIVDRWYGVESVGVWSWRRLWPVVVAIVLAMVVLMLWNRMLRRTVLRRTAELSASEQHLRHSQEQLEATLDALPDLLFEVDREGRVHDFRSPDAGVLFVPPTTFLGHTFAEVLPAEAAAVIQTGLTEAAAKGRHFGGTYQLPLPGGERWFELSITRKGVPGPEGVRFVVLVRDVTTRNMAEGALRESERYIRTLFEQTPVGLALCRMDGSFVDVNPAFARIIGWSVEESRTLTYWALTPEEYAQEEQRQLALLRSTGHYGPYEKHYRHRDGHLVPVSLSGLLLRHRGETCIWSAVEDITERRQTDEALKARQLQMRHVLEAANCLLWQARVVRRETGEFDWRLYIPRSSLYRRLFGMEPGDPPLLAWRTLAVTEVDAMQANCQRALSSGATGYEQEFHATVGGRTLWLREQVSIELVQAREWTLVGVITDITARKLAEEALRVREANYRELFENNPAPMLIYERGSLRLLAVNEAFERHYGYGRDEALALHLPDLYPAEERQAIVELAARLHGPVDAGEWHHLCKGGARITIVARSHDIVFAGCTGRIAVITDISERVRAEAERQALEEQMLRSQRLESVGRLAGGIAHDLNNILSPLLLGSSLLREAIDSPEGLETLTTMEISAKRGADIISQLLTFSRGGTGERVPVQLAIILREMAAIIRETFPKNIVARVDVSPALWLIDGNPTQLHQVVMNLCVNARDAMPAGGVLKLALANVVLDAAAAGALPGAAPGPHLLLTVADNGCGIAREDLDKIFDPFFTTKDPGRGTGLGLSTVLGIVKSHSGIVQVVSRIGEGTQFRVYLPARPELAPPPKTEVARGVMGNGELVLLVDDEAGVRAVTRRVLEQHRYRVVEAGDGRAALTRFDSAGEAIAVVISDVLMPVLDGVAFIRELRRLNTMVPVVVVSGYADASLPTLLAQGQVQAVLPKPYESVALLACLHGVLHPAETAEAEGTGQVTGPSDIKSLV